MKNAAWIIFVAFLGGIAAFSVTKYISAQKESYSLSIGLDQMKGEVGSLQAQKQNLLETIEKQQIEQAAMNSDLAESKGKIVKMEIDFAQAQEAIEDLNAQLNLLREENVSLKNEEGALRSELAGVNQEKDALQTKLSSLAELKKAIRELKIRMRTIRPQAQEKQLVQEAIEGNCGFIIKDGQLTHPTRVKIEVNPAPLR